MANNIPVRDPVAINPTKQLAQIRNDKIML
jgi:hypothetical protein